MKGGVDLNGKMEFRANSGGNAPGDGHNTRAKSNTQLRRVYSAPVDRGTGILCDQTVALTGTTSVLPVSASL